MGCSDYVDPLISVGTDVLLGDPTALVTAPVDIYTDVQIAEANEAATAAQAEAAKAAEAQRLAAIEANKTLLGEKATQAEEARKTRLRLSLLQSSGADGGLAKVTSSLLGS